MSMFGGSQPAVDRWLEEQGLLRVIRDTADVGDVAPRTTEPKALWELRERGTKLSEIFISTIEATAHAHRRNGNAPGQRNVSDRPSSAR
jgi:hypothetical protein